MIELLKQLEPRVEWLTYDADHAKFHLSVGQVGIHSTMIGKSNRLYDPNGVFSSLLLGLILSDITDRLNKAYPDPDYRPFAFALQYGEGYGELDEDHPDAELLRGWFFNGGAEGVQWQGFDEFEPVLAALRGYLEFLELTQ